MSEPIPTATALPAAPMTLDGSSVLHQMFRVRWETWRSQDATTQDCIVKEFAAWLAGRESAVAGSQSAAFGMLGHKGDLMLLHFRPRFEELLEAQLQLKQLRISDYLDVCDSYVSVVELGLYESTRKLYEELGARGLQQGSDEWDKAAEEILDRQRKAMGMRLQPAIPEWRFLCFYPMDKKRGEEKNWYSVPFTDRQRMMHEHGMIGRKYAGSVKQIISGSIGFDNWEWGVDLFAEDPVQFKQLIYEMRFDEASAVYALFGPFYTAMRVRAEGLIGFMRGDAQSALK